METVFARCEVRTGLLLLLLERQETDPPPPPHEKGQLSCGCQGTSERNAVVCSVFNCQNTLRVAYKYQNGIFAKSKRTFSCYSAQVTIIVMKVKFHELLNNTYICIACQEHFLLLRFKLGDITKLVAYVQLKKKILKQSSNYTGLINDL
jgi:hypothetical protein